MLIYGHGHPPGENYVCVKRKSSSHPSRLQLYGIVKRHTGEKNERGEGGKSLKPVQSSRPPVETPSSAHCNGFTNYGHGGAAIELWTDRGWEEKRRSEEGC